MNTSWGKLWNASILKNLDNYSENFRKLLWKILRNILKNFENMAGNFENYFIIFWGIFRKILRIISENVENNFKKFHKISRNTSNIFEKYFGIFGDKLLKKFLVKFWKIWRPIKLFRKNFSSISDNFKKKLWRISRSISQNFG